MEMLWNYNWLIEQIFGEMFMIFTNKTPKKQYLKGQVKSLSLSTTVQCDLNSSHNSELPNLEYWDKSIPMKQHD